MRQPWLTFAVGAAVLVMPLGAGAQIALQPQVPPPAAQTAPQSAEQRAAQLKAVVASVTSPDRDLNIANFEQLMESGDVRRIEIAVRTLVASDDPVLRGLAMRGYIAVTRELVLQVALSAPEMKALQDARVLPNGVNNIKPPYRHLSELDRVGFKFTFDFEPTSIKEPRGKVVSLANKRDPNAASAYAVRGERITFSASPAYGWARCDFDLAPRKDATIVGTMTCGHSGLSAPVTLIAPMF
jgi:hypothetical protein